MRYTLKQLEVFLAVARYSSLSKAAEQLHMSQSAASESLAKLERQYTVALFDRIGKKLRLNAFGRGVQVEAERLMQQAKEFESVLSGQRDLGHLRVAASFTIGNHMATRCLAGYLECLPAAKVTLDTANTPDVVERVLDYRADIGLIEHEVSHPELDLIPWISDSLTVFCAADHPLADRVVLSNEDIANARWILREPTSGARRTFDQAMSNMLPDINVFLELRHNEAIKTAVEAGLGLGCLSQIVLRRNIAAGELVPLTIKDVDFSRRLYFVLPKSRHHSRSVDTWIQECRKAFGE